MDGDETFCIRKTTKQINKIRTIQKYKSLQDLQNVQNMNYGNYTKYLKMGLRFFLGFFQVSQSSECIFALLVYFVQEIVIFNIGFCVFNSIWEHWLNLFLNMFSNTFKKKKQKCEQFSHGPLFFEMFWDSGS